VTRMNMNASLLCFFFCLFFPYLLVCFLWAAKMKNVFKIKQEHERERTVYRHIWIFDIIIIDIKIYDTRKSGIHAIDE
jgi:hypothetical protein